MPSESSSTAAAAPRRRWVAWGVAVALLLLGVGIASPFAYRWVSKSWAIRQAPSKDGVQPVGLKKPGPAPQGYAGSSVCSECHAQIASTYAKHPMAQSMHRTLAGGVEDYEHGTDFSPRPQRKYRVEKTATQVLHHELGIDAAGEVIYDQAVPVSYAMGSGRRGRSYVFIQDGYLLESPISWYSKKSRWDLSPGYPAEEHQRFERPIVDRCVQCHVGRMNYPVPTPSIKALRYADPPIAELSIGCERCHGPAEAHVRWRREKQPSGTDPIVNPARLDPPRREAVCNQCHLQGEHQILRYGRRSGDFRPGEQLGETWSIFVSGTGVVGGEGTIAVSQVEQMYASQCFQKSRGALGCISCHDPHSFPADDEKASLYQARCLKCHEDHGCSVAEQERMAPPAAGSCIACHMPRLAALDIPHTTQTDHRIVRRPAPKNRDTTTPDDPALEIFDRFVCPLPPLEMARAQGLAVAERAETLQHVGYARQAEQLLRPVAEAVPDDLDVLESLALAISIQGRREESAGVWKQSLAHDPTRPDALYSLAVYYQGVNDFPQAVVHMERLLAQVPWRAEFHVRYSFLLEQVGETDSAVAAALHSIELDPSASRTYGWLADLYLKQNYVEAFQRCRETKAKLEGK